MDVLDIVKKNINIGGLAIDLIDELLEPALQKLVDDTETEFDNMAKDLLFPKIKEQLKKLIDEQVAKI